MGERDKIVSEMARCDCCIVQYEDRNCYCTCKNYQHCLSLKERGYIKDPNIEKAKEERTNEILNDLIGHRFAYEYTTADGDKIVKDYVVSKDDVKFLVEKYKKQTKE